MTSSDHNQSKSPQFRLTGSPTSSFLPISENGEAKHFQFDLPPTVPDLPTQPPEYNCARVLEAFLLTLICIIMFLTNYPAEDILTVQSKYTFLNFV